MTTIEILSPSNKQRGSLGQSRYLEKRSSALHGGLHWVEIDLLRGGERPPLPTKPPPDADYLAYVGRATASGWEHLLYGWRLRDPLPRIAVPLLGEDEAVLDLAGCFREAYDRIAADDEAEYAEDPPPPPLSPDDRAWARTIIAERGLLPPQGRGP